MNQQNYKRNEWQLLINKYTKKKKRLNRYNNELYSTTFIHYKYIWSRYVNIEIESNNKATGENLNNKNKDGTRGKKISHIKHKSASIVFVKGKHYKYL